MFKILRKTAQTGLVTIGYPEKPALLSMRYRGAPRFDFSHWRDSRPAAEVCPTGAISIEERDDTRLVTVDYGLCIYCGQCAVTGATWLSPANMRWMRKASKAN
jgi:formate hydrogenlyase subunit 6/NADH:ubiquinone oxidoreductase subunit I